jgi:hypothetical protein
MPFLNHNRGAQAPQKGKTMNFISYNRFLNIELAGDFWGCHIVNSNKELVKGLLVTRSYRNAWLCYQGATTAHLRAHLGCDYY